MKDVTFCCLAFGEAYVSQQERLKKSILDIYPDADLLFYTDSYPQTARNHLQSMYGFKPQVMREAKGRYVIWLDPAMILMKPIDPEIFNNPVVVVRDDNKLASFISDKFLDRVEKTREDIKDVHLVGGSYYIFDTQNPTAQRVFFHWLVFEELGYFGSQEEEASGRLQGHRSDEACMAMALHLEGVEPMSHEEAGYNHEGAVWIKKHFK